MREKTFTESSFAKDKKPSGKEKLSTPMGATMPRRELIEVEALHYPRPVGKELRPIGVGWMLRIHFI